MVNIMIICRAHSDESSFSRWRKMAQDYPDISITVVGDSKYKIDGWEKSMFRETVEIIDGRFRYIPLPFVNNRQWRGGYAAKGLGKIIKETKPDFIYLIGTETFDVIFQVAWAIKFYLPDTKIALFTMRGTKLPLSNPNFRLRWKFVRSFVDAFYCHCPRTIEVLRIQGKVRQPIYMQTQVGVSVDIFKPDKEKRKRIREKYGIKNDEYLFGSVSRMDIRKGLLDMIEALPVKSKWKFIMIGSGPDQKVVKEAVRSKGLEDRVLLPGYIDGWENVSEYINALDCSILMSKTLPDNCDTFALAVAQSMAVGLPVIVSDSGGLAYQVGEKGVIVHEGDITGLHKAMEFVSGNPEEGRKIGEVMRKRLLSSFAVPHLNRCFYYTVRDILNDEFNMAHMDQQNFTFEK